MRSNFLEYGGKLDKSIFLFILSSTILLLYELGHKHFLRMAAHARL